MNILDTVFSPLDPLFASWARPQGTLAIAVCAPQIGVQAESYHADVTPAQITELWPLIENSFHEAAGQDLASRRIRFLGRQRELHCFRRTDGAVLAVLLAGTQAGRTEAELEELAARFEQCAGVLEELAR